MHGPFHRLGWQYFTNQRLVGAYVPSFGAFGAAWNDAMVARWSAAPLTMLWPESDAAIAADGDGGGPPVATRRPVVVVVAAG